MSLSSLLSIARSALLTHKRAMEVTANNVANAQTPEEFYRGKNIFLQVGSGPGGIYDIVGVRGHHHDLPLVEEHLLLSSQESRRDISKSDARYSCLAASP